LSIFAIGLLGGARCRFNIDAWRRRFDSGASNLERLYPSAISVFAAGY
jgi:hypothetical protein